eukprot:1159889-Pelagomonas_calceolata.AAC.2
MSPQRVRMMRSRQWDLRPGAHVHWQCSLNGMWACWGTEMDAWAQERMRSRQRGWKTHAHMHAGDAHKQRCGFVKEGTRVHVWCKRGRVAPKLVETMHMRAGGEHRKCAGLCRGRGKGECMGVEGDEGQDLGLEARRTRWQCSWQNGCAEEEVEIEWGYVDGCACGVKDNRRLRWGRGRSYG